MKKILFATSNEHKMKEIRQILSGIDCEILSMRDIGLNIHIEENGTTFMENALIKARAVWKECGGVVIADDSGLVIDALNGEPGIYSARYLGEDTPAGVKNEIILGRLKDIEKKDRSARYIAAVAAILEDGKELSTAASFEGEISETMCGNGGFGYDPIFFVPEFNKTCGELTDEEKNAVSHRGKALRQMKELLVNEGIDCE